MTGLDEPVDAARESGLLSLRAAVLAFLAFAFAYFFSALVRAVTATLAPIFSAELGLSASDLGLLAGAYFFGFAATQLPLGGALDRFGPRRVLLGFLSLGVAGCAAFALAEGLAGLIASRMLIGVGVSACLMAPMTAFRRMFTVKAQMRAASWMLMTGSLGMLASTLPVQWLLPLMGWRGLFWTLAVALLLALAAIVSLVPRDRAPVGMTALGPGYAQVFRHRSFLRLAPMGFFNYGGLIAIQTLWAGPWLTNIRGWTSDQAALGLFTINLSMLGAFLAWGIVVPRLYARGWTAQRLMVLGMPVSLLALALAVVLGARAGTWVWALYCVGSTFASLAQPAIAQTFPARLAGRGLSAYNLVIFGGVFFVQWGIGLCVDWLQGLGWSQLSAYRGAFSLFAACCALAYVWLLRFDDVGSALPSMERAVDNRAG